MRLFIQKTFILAFVVTALTGFALTAFAAGTITTPEKYSQFIGVDLDNDGTDDFINWAPTQGGATITDHVLTGSLWGETVGWINLAPATEGVTNTCKGELGGYAWGQNTGWINFAPTNTLDTPKINVHTGAITGQVWAQNYGWINLASPDGVHGGLTTSWRPGPSCHRGGGGGSTPTLRVIKQVSGGTATPDDFVISVKENGADIVAPFLGSDAGTTMSVNTSSQRTLAVSEVRASDYSPTFSSDCPLGIVEFPSGFQGQKVCIITNIFGPQDQYACKDPAATNYSTDPQAIAKNSLCMYPVAQYACKDQDALNYNADPALIARNSLCRYPVNQYACKDPAAINYSTDPNALAKNSLCNYPTSSYGCTDPDASNYDNRQGVITQNGLCQYPKKQYACKDPDALNYDNDTAHYPDNSLCEYDATGGGGTGGSGGTLPWWERILGALIPWMIIRGITLILTISWDRRKILGVVYDSVTKEPLDPVVVSVMNTETNTEIISQITDMEGRFGFTLDKGRYHINAQKTHYQYPSPRLAGRLSDEVYDHLYFGEPFEVKDEKKVVTMNIPMDPIEKDWNQEEKHRKSFIHFLIKGQTKLSGFFNALFIFAFIVSIIITYFYPVWWNYAMTSVYVLVALYRVYWHNALYAGTITRSGIPLVNVMVRVWDPKLNREVAHKTTNASGAYYALVPAGRYYVTVEERLPDGTYNKIHTSGVIRTRAGVVSKSIRC